MSIDISKLNPTILWGHFARICSIPHPSKHEQQLSKHIIDWAKAAGIDYTVDAVGNVVLRKKATKGMENRKGLILQAHIDMVPQKNGDKDFDFLKDPIEPVIDGEWVRANATTLGADNGIGVSAILTAFETCQEHGDIEALLTIDEETGMTGVFGLKSDLLKGEIMLNLDSEDEGELCVGCAGGANVIVSKTYKKEAISGDVSAFEIDIKGLNGGHSGINIILQGGNSNKLMFRILKNASNELGLKIAKVEGGNMRNAIPREAKAVVVIPSDNTDAFKKLIRDYTEVFKNELSAIEKSIEIILKDTTIPDYVIDNDSQRSLINGIISAPNGVIRMSDTMLGTVETSTNLAIVSMTDNIIEVVSLARSSVDTMRKYTTDMICTVFGQCGFNCDVNGEYSGWTPNPDSPILIGMRDTYNKMYGKIPEIKAIHAGLECGIIGGIYKDLDMISFGPTIRHPHSPDEKVNIESVSKFYNFLLETIKNAPKK